MILLYYISLASRHLHVIHKGRQYASDCFASGISPSRCVNAEILIPKCLKLKKFQSLKLCYIGLYHRKSKLSFSTLHLKGIYVPDNCVFRNVHTINNNHPNIYNGFDQAAKGPDEGSDVDLFFFERMNTEENPFLFVTTPATNIP